MPIREEFSGRLALCVQGIVPVDPPTLLQVGHVPTFPQFRGRVDVIPAGPGTGAVSLNILTLFFQYGAFIPAQTGSMAHWFAIGICRASPLLAGRSVWPERGFRGKRPRSAAREGGDSQHSQRVRQNPGETTHRTDLNFRLNRGVRVPVPPPAPAQQDAQGAGPPLNTKPTRKIMSAEVIVPVQFTSPDSGTGSGAGPPLNTCPTR